MKTIALIDYPRLQETASSSMSLLLSELLNTTTCIDLDYRPSVNLKLKKWLHLERRTVPEKQLCAEDVEEVKV
jgi:hypothetical protein